MKIRTLLFVSIIFTQICTAQKKPLPEISINHIYFVVDDSTYKMLDKIPFIKDTLFTCQGGTTVMDGETWSGKYLVMKRNYLEVFSPTGYAKAQLGETGLGFYLHEPVRMMEVRDNWQQQTKDAVIIDPVTQNKGKDTAWNDIQNYKDTLPEGKHAGVFIMSYPRKYYINFGFSADQVEQGLPFDSILAKMRIGRTFIKRALEIRSIHMNLTPEEYKRITDGLKAIGFTGSGRTFKKDITIIIDKQKAPVNRVDEIVIRLNEVYPEKRVIEVSPHLRIVTENDTATLTLH